MHTKTHTIHALFLFLVAVAASCSTAFASDSIVLKDGTVVTGKILEQDAGHVYFKPETSSPASFAVSDIAEIRMEIEGLGDVVVPANAIVDPELAKSAAPTQPGKDNSGEKESSWSGQAGLSLAMRQSNTLRRSGDQLVEKKEEFETYRAYGNINWQGGKNDLKWDWIYRYSKTDVRKSDDFLNLTQSYKHDFTKKLFTRAKTMYQQDFRRGIDNEYLQTAELGINWFDSGNLKFLTSIGGGYHEYDRVQEQYSTGQGKFILDESLHWVINSLTLFQKYTHLGNLQNYHFVFNSGAENQLIQDIFLRFEYKIDRDTEVNYSDKSYYDKVLLTSVVYKF